MDLAEKYPLLREAMEPNLDELFFAAVGSAMDIVSPFELDMVDSSDCRESPL